MRVVSTSLLVAFLSFSLTIGVQEETSSTASAESQSQGTQAEAVTYKTPESYVDYIKKSGAVLEVSLNDTIRLALSNNLDLVIENYNEELDRERIVQQRGFYDPRFLFDLTWNSFEQPNTRVLDAGADILTRIVKRWQFDTSYQQNLPGGYGTGLQIFFRNDRGTTNDFFSTINPNYGADLGFGITQPLLRGFRETQTERQIKLFNLDKDLSDSQFKQRVAEVIQQVKSQYWELVYAIQNYEARRRSLELAIIQYNNNRKRVDIGVMAPIEITSSRAEVANREQELIASEVQIINAQNSFKGLLSSDPKESIWNISLIPADQPQVQDIGLTMDDAIDMGLRRRPELEQFRLENAKLEVDRKFLKKQGKPQVDLNFGLTSIGTAGETFQLVPDPDNPGEQIKIPDPTNPFSGDFRESWDQAFRFRFLNWQVGVSVDIPIGNRQNEAQLAQVAINERRLRSQEKNVQQDIMVEVRNAYESITTQRKRFEAARVARQLSEEQLAGENKRFEAGLSTNFEVLRYQRDLAESQVLELRAMVDYQLALTALQQATFSIVDDNDIVLAKRDSVDAP